MDQQKTIQRLEETKNMPHATIEDLKYIPSNIPTDILEEYLKKMAKPSNTCWLCKEHLSYSWGLVHGVAHCCDCGIEVRLYHFPKDEEGKEYRFETPLQYHPSTYSIVDDENDF